MDTPRGIGQWGLVIGLNASGRAWDDGYSSRVGDFLLLESDVRDVSLWVAQVRPVVTSMAGVSKWSPRRNDKLQKAADYKHKVGCLK